MREREEDRDSRPALFGDLGDGERDFILDLGDREPERERDSCLLLRGVVECFPFEADLERVLDRSFTAATVRPSDCCLLGLGVGDRL